MSTRSVRTTLFVVVASVTVVWLLVVLLWRDAPFGLTFDDAFYYFGIARNVAHGHGSTFDGINPTNGYHPLWMLLAVPLYAAGADGTPAVRTLLAVQVLCYGAALLVLASVVARAVDGWPRLARSSRPDTATAARWCTAVVAGALAAIALNPFVVKVFVNGMESGILVLFDAAIIAVGARWRGRLLRGGTSKSRWWTSVLLAGALLARTDTIILLGVMGLWAIAEAWTEAPRQWGSAVRALVELFALPAVVLIGYLVSNQVMFGLLIQVSGLTKRASLDATRIGWLVVVAIVAVLVSRWGYVRSRRRAATAARFGRVAGFASSTAWFGAFCILMVAYYQLLQTQQWLWYYCPVVIYLMTLLVVGVADFVEAAMLEGSARSAARAVLPVSAILLVPLVVALLIEVGQMRDRTSYSLAVADRDAGQWIDQHVPPGTVLASWDAGALGYYAHRPVINLDGVANSYDYYKAARAGTVGEFLKTRHLAGVVNVGTPTDGRDSEIEAFVRQTLGSSAGSRLRLVRRWPFRYSGTTTGAGGNVSGLRDLAIFLYELPPPTPAHS
jgi:hypothetical protein